MALHVLSAWAAGGAERLAAILMRALGLERFEAGVLSSLDPPFATDLEETLAQDGICAWHLGTRQGFESQTLVRIARVLDRVGSQGGSAILLHLQGLTQRAPALEKHERFR